MPPPYQLALAAIRLIGMMNLVGGLLLFLASFIGPVFASAKIEWLEGLGFALLSYAALYLTVGIAFLLFQRPIARFAVKVIQDRSAP
jgi:hypothetical protein